MTPLQQIETSVLQAMVSAFSANYGRELSEAEKRECKIEIDLMLSEIESRKTVCPSPLTVFKAQTPPLSNDGTSPDTQLRKNLFEEAFRMYGDIPKTNHPPL